MIGSIYRAAIAARDRALARFAPPAPIDLEVAPPQPPAPLVAAERRLGPPTPLPPGARAERAAAALAGPRGYYGLGCGGEDPARPLPWGRYRARKGEDPARVRVRTAAGWVWLDCSGAIAWLLGLPRRLPGYARGWGYLSTDGLLADAEDPAVELVDYLPIGAEVRPWEVLADYGWQDQDDDGVRDGGEIGHVGAVAAVPAGWRYTGPEAIAELSIWHCASSRSATGAIRVSDGRAWRRRGRLVRVLG